MVSAMRFWGATRELTRDGQREAAGDEGYKTPACIAGQGAFHLPRSMYAKVWLCLALAG